MTTANSGGASQITTRPGHASRNSLQLPTKNGGSRRPPRLVPLSSWPITPIKMKRSKPLPTVQRPLPVIAPQSQLSLQPIVPSPPTALPPTHSSSLPFRTLPSFRLPSPNFARNLALQSSIPPVANTTTTSGRASTAVTTLVAHVPLHRWATGRKLPAREKRLVQTRTSNLLPDTSRELLIPRILLF